MDREWLDVLRAQCAATSQSAVAKALGVSPSMVNQVLKGTYRGDVERLRQLFEGAFMGAVVRCPELGELPRQKCLEHQARPLIQTNFMRRRLYYACQACEHNRNNNPGGDKSWKDKHT